MSTIPVDPNDPNGRGGVPVDKFGMHATPLQQYIEGKRRQCVIILLYPPEALRDASREQVTDVLFTQGEAILATIAEEIHKSYTSDPIDAAAARNVAEALTRHAVAQEKKG